MLEPQYTTAVNQASELGVALLYYLAQALNLRLQTFLIMVKHIETYFLEKNISVKQSETIDQKDLTIRSDLNCLTKT